MFTLDYRIVHSEYDDFIGENGFLQIKCNECKYGEMYPKELEMIMDKVSLYDWFDRLVRVVKNLLTRDYVVLSDVESYNTWIEFHKINEEIVISIVKAEKEQGSRDIEFELRESIAGEWADQVINFIQFKTEIIEKAREYIQIIIANNAENLEIIKLKENLDTLQKL
ncbi:MAG: hypothetical protein U0K68_14020 [Agathobacter sp.]|nr:hypothetical protein [Agathobacter sp.]